MHAAGVLRDALLLKQTASSFREVLAGKVCRGHSKAQYSKMAMKINLLLFHCQQYEQTSERTAVLVYCTYWFSENFVPSTNSFWLKCLPKDFGAAHSTPSRCEGSDTVPGFRHNHERSDNTFNKTPGTRMGSEVVLQRLCHSNRSGFPGKWHVPA